MSKSLLLAAAFLLACTPLGTTQADAAGVCSQVNMPVCAVTKDGVRKNYTNAGCAGIEGARVLHKDACRWVTCVPWVKPVCANDPATRKPTRYDSICSAEFYSATVLNDGACPVKR